MITAVLIAAIYATMISHTPMTPLIDTYALPVLVFLLLRDLDPRILRWLGLLIGLVICANAVIAILEYHRHFHLVSIDVPEGATSDPRRGDATFDWRAQLANDWRATALLGHPLTNGLITGAFIICLCARGSRWIPVAIKIPIVLLQATALLAFGARTALVLTIVCSAWVGVQRCLGALRNGARIEPRHLAIVLIGLGAAAAIGAILFASGFGDQTIQRFQQDQGSAETRITMFKLFDPLSFSDMLLGPDPDVIATGSAARRPRVRHRELLDLACPHLWPRGDGDFGDRPRRVRLVGPEGQRAGGRCRARVLLHPGERIRQHVDEDDDLRADDRPRSNLSPEGCSAAAACRRRLRQIGPRHGIERHLCATRRAAPRSIATRPRAGGRRRRTAEPVPDPLAPEGCHHRHACAFSRRRPPLHPDHATPLSSPRPRC